MEQTTNEANVQKKGGARLKKSSRSPLLIPGIVVGVLAAGYLGLCTYAGSLDTFYPSRCINGINVGKLTAVQAQDKLESEFPARPVTLVDENGQDLADLTLADLGYTPELFEGDAQFWLTDQQRDSFLRRGWSYLNILTGRWPGGWNWPDPDQSVLDATVAHLSDTLSSPAVDAEYTLEGATLEVPMEVQYATGCFLFIRSKALYRLGGFDEQYFLYHEDSDLSRKALEMGKIVYHPDFRVVHDWHRDSAHSTRALRNHIVSTWKYFRKWGWAW